MKNKLTEAGWSSVLLVCKDCPKRSSGPKNLKANAVASESKRALKTQRVNARVVRCSCLGICPKKELVIASVGPQGTCLTTVDSLAQVEHAVKALASHRAR